MVYSKASSSAPVLSYVNRTAAYHAVSSVVSPVHKIFILSPSYALVTFEDWRAGVYSLTGFTSVSASSPGTASPIWEREEALASVVRAEMIELPPGIHLNTLVTRD